MVTVTIPYILSSLRFLGRPQLGPAGAFKQQPRFRPPENLWLIPEPDCDFLHEFLGRFSTQKSFGTSNKEGRNESY